MDTSRLSTWARSDATSGLMLIAAAAAALLWANSPWAASYATLRDVHVGPPALGLHLSLSDWAADAVLAIFFFVVGLELAHEVRHGSLRNPRAAAVPALAAVGGMIAPALLFVGIVMLRGDRSALGGWAVPTATDIAFAVAVLALASRGLPRELRVFLLTLAVVDDLLAIIVIAVFYTDRVELVWLGAALASAFLFWLLARTRWARWWLLLPAAVLVWTLMHNSGVHATIAGVLLGFAVPTRAIFGEPETRNARWQRLWAPVSGVIALPVFAFFAAGVPLMQSESGSSSTQPVAAAVAIALIVGKFIGVWGTTALVVRCTPLALPKPLTLTSLVPISALAGVGFTVSLLITELAFADAEHASSAKVGVLIGSGIAAVVAAVLLRVQSRTGARDAGRR